MSSKNQLTTVKFDSSQAKQLLSRVLFHLANSPLKCLILSRQVLTASFTSYKAVQIQKILLLSATIWRIKKYGIRLFKRMRRKSNFPKRNQALDLRIRRSDVLQLSCSKFYGEPDESLLRFNVTRDLDTLDPLEFITDGKLNTTGN